MQVTPALPKHVIEFDLPEEKWLALQKAAAVLGKKEIRIVSDGEAVHIQTFDQRTRPATRTSCRWPRSQTGSNANKF